MIKTLQSACCGVVVWETTVFTGYCSGCFSPTVSGGCWMASGERIQDDEWVQQPHRIPAVRHADAWQPLRSLWELDDGLPISILFEEGLGRPRVPTLQIEHHKAIPYLTVSVALLKEWNVPKTIRTVGELKQILG